MIDRRCVVARIAALLVLGAPTACGGPLPDTSYYRLVVPQNPRAVRGETVLEVEDLQVDAAYDDRFIAYRPNRYELQHYAYHAWAAPPALLVSDYLRQALAHSGHFARVIREPSSRAGLRLEGRLTAFEEVDASRQQWLGHVALELHLKDATTGELLWSGRYDESVPLRRRNPEGLAAALSLAMARISRQSAASMFGSVSKERGRVRDDGCETVTRRER